MKSIPAIGRWTGSGSGGARGIILSGGPASVYDADVPGADQGLLALGVPILGICYGMQLIAHLEGALVVPGKREYGRAELTVENPGALFDGFAPGERTIVWCSHGDHVDAPPAGYRVLAFTESAAGRPRSRIPGAGSTAFSSIRKSLIRPAGDEVISNFLFGVCCCEPTWTAGAFIDDTVDGVLRQVGQGGRVICGLSGGVDSSVAASLVHRAVGATGSPACSWTMGCSGSTSATPWSAPSASTCI